MIANKIYEHVVFHYFRIRRYFPAAIFRLFHLQKFALGRVACAGHGVYNEINGNRKYNEYYLINNQKARVDVLLGWLNGGKKPIAKKVYPYMLRKDVYPFIVQQEQMVWEKLKSDFEYLIMDSYSELTDQKFTHKTEGWSFCCHYSDIQHSDDFESLFDCNGLLDQEAIEEAYIRFFSWFENRYPQKKIVFLHYSTKFDDRDKFKERSQKILEVMDKIQKEKSYIINVFLDEKDVYKSEEDHFPYHYTKDTFKAYVKRWEDLNRDDNS